LRNSGWVTPIFTVASFNASGVIERLANCWSSAAFLLDQSCANRGGFRLHGFEQFLNPFLLRSRQRQFVG